MTVDTDREIAAPEATDAGSTADPGEIDDTNDSDDLGEENDADQPKVVAPKRRRLHAPKSPQRQALIVLVLVIGVLTGVAGWLGWQVYQSHRLSQDHAALLQAGRQGALNLTTVDWQHADADVQRILDSATGTFHEDFSMRSKPFVDVSSKPSQHRWARLPRQDWNRRPPTKPRYWSRSASRSQIALDPNRIRVRGGCGFQCRRSVTT